MCVRRDEQLPRSNSGSSGFMYPALIWLKPAGVDVPMQ
jgi:hypothetical protein